MKGQRVILPDGREGVVADEFRERGGCGCRMVIVRLPSGRDWLGKAAEVRVANVAQAFTAALREALS